MGYSNNFPSDVLKWMKINANPPMALKFMQTCKYFQHEKFPYFVAKSFYLAKQKWGFRTLTDKRHIIPHTETEIPENIWVTNTLYLSTDPIRLQEVFLKVVVLDIKVLRLYHQKLSLQNFKFLTNNCDIKYFDAHHSIITDENNDPVLLELIFNCLPNVELVKLDTIGNLEASWDILTSVSSKLERFKIHDFDGRFNFEAFTDFMIGHQHVLFIIGLYKDKSQKFIKRIQSCVDKVMNAWLPDSKVFDINYFGQTKQSLNLLRIFQKRLPVPQFTEKAYLDKQRQLDWNNQFFSIFSSLP